MHYLIVVEVQGMGREGDDQDPDSSLGNGFWINVGQRSLTWLRLGTILDLVEVRYSKTRTECTSPMAGLSSS
ncbi:hypothetical protein L3X38_038551 [Prunus dulcis]|uniref:Uncharacterized protein n=1 Tax=Prunus dulcis TaxID=3755 RepID=A0AAD4V5T6_PRUDU|nr:hypothetical protein L3X38_038551 [Prunus dulcis]